MKKTTTILKNIFTCYPISLITLVVITHLSLFRPTEESSTLIKDLDKIIHFCMYAGFCSILWFEYFRSHKNYNIIKIMLGTIVAPILFSGAMELAQSYLTEHRSGDWYDFLFNCMGVFAASLLGIYIIRPITVRYKARNRGFHQSL